MTIESPDYNLDRIIEILLKKYLNENKTYSYKQLALDFGVSERTIYRWLIKYGIQKKNPTFEERVVGYLNRKGYNVEKK